MHVIEQLDKSFQFLLKTLHRGIFSTLGLFSTWGVVLYIGGISWVHRGCSVHSSVSCWSILWVLQDVTALICRFKGISPFSVLHNTCWVRSPLTPKLRARNGSKYLDHTLWYLASPFTSESPIRRTDDKDLAAIAINFSCSSYLILDTNI